MSTLLKDDPSITTKLTAIFDRYVIRSNGPTTTPKATTATNQGVSDRRSVASGGSSATAAGDWGDLKAVCGPKEGGGEVPASDAQGVTADSIELGTVADPGFSGRPGLVMDVPFTSGMVGAFDTQLTYEFFQGFVNHAGVTLHIDNLKGVNAHHQCETVFKAFARAVRAALELDPRSAGVIPSTKGSL